MDIKRVGFVGVRTDAVAETATFFRNVLGLRALRTDPNWQTQQLPTGPWDLVEVFRSDFTDTRLIPSEVDGVFVAFIVDNLAAARADAEAAEAELIGETIWADQAFDDPKLAGIGWFFMRGPDGNVYVIQQSPD